CLGEARRLIPNGTASDVLADEHLFLRALKRMEKACPQSAGKDGPSSSVLRMAEQRFASCGRTNRERRCHEGIVAGVGRKCPRGGLEKACVETNSAQAAIDVAAGGLVGGHARIGREAADGAAPEPPGRAAFSQALF